MNCVCKTIVHVSRHDMYNEVMRVSFPISAVGGPRHAHTYGCAFFWFGSTNLTRSTFRFGRFGLTKISKASALHHRKWAHNVVYAYTCRRAIVMTIGWERRSKIRNMMTIVDRKNFQPIPKNWFLRFGQPNRTDVRFRCPNRTEPKFQWTVQPHLTPPTFGPQHRKCCRRLV